MKNNWRRIQTILHLSFAISFARKPALKLSIKIILLRNGCRVPSKQVNVKFCCLSVKIFACFLSPLFNSKFIINSCTKKEKTQDITPKSLILLVSSVGLLHFVSFTALIGIAYRHTPVRLSLVSNPLFRGFLALDTSPTKKATIKVALLLVSSVGFEPATL